MEAEAFEQEWKRYCDSKGGGAVTMNLKDVAQHFAKYGCEQAKKDIKEWIDNNLSGYITNDGDWADIEHKFKEEFGS